MTSSVKSSAQRGSHDGCLEGAGTWSGQYSCSNLNIFLLNFVPFVHEQQFNNFLDTSEQTQDLVQTERSEKIA